MRFSVTYEYWTDEDAERGDTDSRGLLAQGVNLRDAIEIIAQDAPPHCELQAIEPSSSPAHAGDWLNVFYGADWREGIARNYGLHACRPLSAASVARLLRLLNS